MGVRWGFKTDADLLALELREELGLRAFDPLNPYVLADHLSIPVVDELGCRHWNGAYEEEANLLAGYLLIPNVAARRIVQRGLSEPRARDHFGVSQEMLTWRLNMSALGE
jgi:hypothetical protein